MHYFYAFEFSSGLWRHLRGQNPPASIVKFDKATLKQSLTIVNSAASLALRMTSVDQRLESQSTYSETLAMPCHLYSPIFPTGLPLDDLLTLHLWKSGLNRQQFRCLYNLCRQESDDKDLVRKNPAVLIYKNCCVST